MISSDGSVVTSTSDLPASNPCRHFRALIFFSTENGVFFHNHLSSRIFWFTELFISPPRETLRYVWNWDQPPAACVFCCCLAQDGRLNFHLYFAGLPLDSCAVCYHFHRLGFPMDWTLDDILLVRYLIIFSSVFLENTSMTISFTGWAWPISWPIPVDSQKFLEKFRSECSSNWYYKKST